VLLAMAGGSRSHLGKVGSVALACICWLVWMACMYNVIQCMGLKKEEGGDEFFRTNRVQRV